jgi:hypothetical protein
MPFAQAEVQAGSFDSSYELSITPQGGVDNDLFKLAVQPNLPGQAGPSCTKALS